MGVAHGALGAFMEADFVIQHQAEWMRLGVST